MKGIVNLSGYNIIADETINTGKYCFKMQHDEERTFYFYTTSEKTLKSWMRALMKATISRNSAGKKKEKTAYILGTLLKDV